MISNRAKNLASWLWIPLLLPLLAFGAEAPTIPKCLLDYRPGITSPFEVLGVPPSAGKAEIEAAFRRLSRELRPAGRSDPDHSRIAERNLADALRRAGSPSSPADEAASFFRSPSSRFRHKEADQLQSWIDHLEGASAKRSWQALFDSVREGKPPAVFPQALLSRSSVAPAREENRLIDILFSELGQSALNGEIREAEPAPPESPAEGLRFSPRSPSAYLKLMDSIVTRKLRTPGGVDPNDPRDAQALAAVIDFLRKPGTPREDPAAFRQLIEIRAGAKRLTRRNPRWKLIENLAQEGIETYENRHPEYAGSVSQMSMRLKAAWTQHRIARQEKTAPAAPTADSAASQPPSPRELAAHFRKLAGQGGDVQDELILAMRKAHANHDSRFFDLVITDVLSRPESASWRRAARECVRLSAGNAYHLRLLNQDVFTRPHAREWADEYRMLIEEAGDFRGKRYQSSLEPILGAYRGDRLALSASEQRSLKRAYDEIGPNGMPEGFRARDYLLERLGPIPPLGGPENLADRLEKAMCERPSRSSTTYPRLVGVER